MTLHFSCVFYTYVDYKPDGTPFYVGKGDIGRVKRLERNNPHHRHIRAKHPLWFRKVVECSTEANCLELEKLLISEIGRKDLGKGPLVNFTDGGEGSSGYRHTETARKKLKARWDAPGAKEQRSATMKLVQNLPEVRIKKSIALKGIVRTPETLQRLSKSSKGRVLSVESRKKLSESVRRFYVDPAVRKSVSERIKLALDNPKTREKLSKVTKGRVWVTRDGANKRLRQEEVSKFLADGWQLGMQFKPT